MKILKLIMILLSLNAVFAQIPDETDEIIVSPEEEALCKEVAADLIDIYKNWSPERDFKILFPRVKDFIDDFYSAYPDFDLSIVEKERLGEILTDLETRQFIAFKSLRDDKIYEEVARFITMKDFYWGYISKELHSQLDAAAGKIKKHTDSKEEELLSEHEAYVAELLEEMRVYNEELAQMQKITDIEVVEALINDEEYSDEMYYLQLKLESLRNENSGEETVSQLSDEINERIMFHIDRKRKELIEYKREDYIWAREDWIESKRLTLFDLKEELNYDLSSLVTDYLEPLEEEAGIGSFEISNALITKIKNNDPDAEAEFLHQIKNKFYSGLTSTFGSYVIFDAKPVFRTFRTNVLIGTIFFMILFFYVYIKVKKNRDSLFIRKIPGLDAIDDAVGRATEMGKPIVYDSGIGYYTQIDTIASMLILKSIAKKVAEFKAEIYVPTCDPIILQISEEMVSSGFLDAGYPEDHKKDNIFFLAYDQFAFAAGVAGILARKKPATAFHFGYYAAESLLISEAGFAAGAIQVAGTTAVAQLPFFITACDYTLIGEELYAAAAYISRDPQIMTNLKLSDYAKLAIGILFIIGTILLTINSEWTFLQDMIYTR
ncbi:MAG: hypothetical protein JXN63_00260 [Candidatus Delongbacteria bacterium]|nr:hypothetical protein [Candidatus Delongbacteria bacterium]